MLTLAPKTNIVERFYFHDVFVYIVMTITTTNNALGNMLGLYPPITGTDIHLLHSDSYNVHCWNYKRRCDSVQLARQVC